MGELPVIPVWLALPLGFIAFLAAVGGWAWRNTRKMVAATLARRPNPTRDEFIAMMANDVEADTAQFLWDTMIVYLEPRLTPHPDDHLTRDLPIDDDDPTMTWLPEFAEARARNWKNWPDWPEEWAGTVRNFGRWLDLGLRQQP